MPIHIHDHGDPGPLTVVGDPADLIPLLEEESDELAPPSTRPETPAAKFANALVSLSPNHDLT